MARPGIEPQSLGPLANTLMIILEYYQIISRTIAAGNCKHTNWPWPTIFTQKACILNIVQPFDRKLKFRSQKVA